MSENSNLEFKIRTILADSKLDAIEFNDICFALALLCYIAKIEVNELKASNKLDDLLLPRSNYSDFIPAPADIFENTLLEMNDITEQRLTFQNSVSDFIFHCLKTKLMDREFQQKWNQIINLTKTGLFLHNWIGYVPPFCINENKISWEQYIDTQYNKTPAALSK